MEHGDQPEASRVSGEQDVFSLCRELNRASAKYIPIGGYAVIFHGFLRTTEDIGILVESSLGNQKNVAAALLTLPDRAAEDLVGEELSQHGVVRVVDEITVDIMFSACGITYEEAQESVELKVVENVPIPFVSAEMLWKMEQTICDKDVSDRIFLA